MRTHPDDIEHQTVGLARIRPGATAEHLLIEHRALRGPCDDDAIDRRFVKAFREDGAVRDHARRARVQALEDSAAGGERGGAIEGLRGNAGGPEGRVVTLNARDEVLSAECNKIRGSQRTQVP